MDDATRTVRWCGTSGAALAVMLCLGVSSAAAAAPGSATAHGPGPQVRALSEPATHACHNHAGAVEGDGEYTDGAVRNVRGISCEQALALIKPRYRWIYAHWTETYHHGFRLGEFRCRITPMGPDDLKTCVSGARRFEFL